MSIYDYVLKDNKGNEVPMNNYKGMTLLIVNTATGCGFTPQYDGLQDLYEELGSDKFEIIDIPCNQFGAQTPGSAEEIESFCTGRFGITFPQMEKSEVNGVNELPLYTYLKKQQGFSGFGKGPKGIAMGAVLKSQDKDYKNNAKIKWNFTKFLVNKDGLVVSRFEPTVSMKEVAKKVKEIVG